MSLSTHNSQYLCSSFVRLDLANLVELLNTCSWLHKPLYDLYLFDAWNKLARKNYRRASPSDHLPQYQKAKTGGLQPVETKHESYVGEE